MRAYFRNIRAFSPSIRLFLVYNLFANAGFGVFQLVFNLYLLELNMREDDIGAFSAVQTVAMGIGGLTLGYLVHRLGSWRCVAYGFGLFLVASSLIAFAEVPWTLYALSALYGLGLAFLFNSNMPFLLDWCKRGQRAQATAVSFSLISLSITMGSLVGGLLPGTIGALVSSVDSGSVEAYRWTLVAGTAIAAIGAVPLLLMTEARTSRPAAPEAVVREPESASERRQVRQDMGVFVLVGGLMSLGVGMVVPFYNVFLISLGADARDVGLVFALGSAVAAVIGLAAPAFGRRLGALNAVFVLRVMIAPFYLLLVARPSIGLAVISHLVRQTSISMAWPVDSTFIGDLLPPKARASVFGLRSAAWNIGTAIAAFIGGRIIVRTGYDWTFVSMVGFTALSACVFTLYYRRHPLIRSGGLPSALPPKRDRAGEATGPKPVPTSS
jgi:MFS family permease